MLPRLDNALFGPCGLRAREGQASAARSSTVSEGSRARRERANQAPAENEPTAETDGGTAFVSGLSVPSTGQDAVRLLDTGAIEGDLRDTREQLPAR